MLDILETINQWIQDKQQIALATVVKTWGSAPRREGSKLGITSKLAMTGSVSGGCVEGAVVEEAIAGLKDGKARLLKFGVADDTAWEVGLTCGGSIEVFVEPLNLSWWEIACERTLHDQYAKTVTILEGANIGEKVMFDAEGKVLFSTEGLSPELIDNMRLTAESMKQSGTAMMNEQRVMVDVIASRPHLILIGGVHVSIPLQTMAHLLGFRVSIIDPRSAFASEERFPDVSAILHTYPDKALPQLGLDPNTYVAVLTHDPKIDDKALITALPSTVPYIGVLSSGKTHEKRVKRLKEAGISDDLIARIHTPVGIDIGASTPEEIAISILAEIVAVRNGVKS